MSGRASRWVWWVPLVLLLASVCALPRMVAAAPASPVDVPYLTGRIVDNSNIMEALTRGQLSERLKAHEQATGNQIVVLTVQTIGDVSIEEYAVKVFEAWKLGQKGKDNGVLVVVAPGDHKMRIEVGYGLEGTLTDGTCGQIIRNVMTPRFKANDYNGGIDEGVKAIVGKIEGTAEVPADQPPSTSSSNGFTVEGADMPWTMRLLLGAFVFGIIGLFTFIGVVTPGAGWFLFFFLIPFWAIFPMVIVGPRVTVGILLTYLVGFPIAKLVLRKTEWYKKSAKGGSGFRWSSGGSSWSSGGSSWSSGGSSFSGGGGSSGGGGASGSW
jgi:uncharacterized protein